MKRYTTRRLLLFVPTLMASSLIVFGIMNILPGDVALVILASEEGGFREDEAELLQPIQPLQFDECGPFVGQPGIHDALLASRYRNALFNFLDPLVADASFLDQILSPVYPFFPIQFGHEFAKLFVRPDGFGHGIDDDAKAVIESEVIVLRKILHFLV